MSSVAVSRMTLVTVSATVWYGKKYGTQQSVSSKGISETFSLFNFLIMQSVIFNRTREITSVKNWQGTDKWMQINRTVFKSTDGNCLQ